MASAELGIKWLLVSKMSVYTGIFLDYGLNNLLNREAEPTGANLVVFQPNTPATFTYNTAINSYGKQMLPLAIGVTARLTLSKRTWDKKYFKFREEQ